jgi:hypothetical protein
MGNINKKELIDLTSKILANLEAPTPSAFEDHLSHKFISRDGYSFLLKGDAIADYDKLINLISKDENFEDISTKTIEDEYLNLLIYLIKIENSAQEQMELQLDQYLAKLRGSIEEFRVIAAIENLSLEGIDEVIIGNVRIIPFSSLEDDLKEEISRTIDPNPHYNSEQKDELKKSSHERIQSFSKKVCAEVVVKAEKEASFVKGLREIDSVINLLRCYIPLLFSSGLNVTLGLNKTFLGGDRYVISFKLGGGFSDKRERLGPLESYVLNDEKLSHLEDNCHMKEMGEILSKNLSSRSEIEKRLSTAIRWIGTAMDEEYDCDKFLKFAVALECLLAKRNEEISTPLAERCTFILSENKEERRDLYKMVKRLYNTRSEIAHKGKVEIEKDQLNKIKWVSISCLMSFCENINKYKWQDFEDLDNWIQEKKFG